MFTIASELESSVQASTAWIWVVLAGAVMAFVGLLLYAIMMAGATADERIEAWYAAQGVDREGNDAPTDATDGAA